MTNITPKQLREHIENYESVELWMPGHGQSYKANIDGELYIISTRCFNTIEREYGFKYDRNIEKPGKNTDYFVYVIK